MVTINKLARVVIDISRKEVETERDAGTLGLHGCNSDNRLIKEKLDWSSSRLPRKSLEMTDEWISDELRKSHD